MDNRNNSGLFMEVIDTAQDEIQIVVASSSVIANFTLRILEAIVTAKITTCNRFDNNGHAVPQFFSSASNLQ